MGSVFGENSFYRAPGGKWAQETCAGCPQQRHATGEPSKVQDRDRVRIVEGSCGYWAHVVSIRGKFVLSRNLSTRLGGGVTMWLNVVLTPPRSLPRSQNSGTGPSASCGYCCPLCPRGVGIRGEVVLSSPMGSMGTGDVCRLPPAAARHGRAGQAEEPGKVQGRDRVGIVEGSCVYLARGVSIRGKFVI